MDSSFSFPFPVLGNGNDIGHQVPSIEMVRTINGPTVELRLETSPIATGHATLDHLVAEGKAGWFLRVHCARTYFRKEYAIAPADPAIRISTDDVEGKTTCELFLVALQDISKYQPADMHSDYGGASFHVRQAEVLAIIDTFETHIEPRFDPMEADPQSFIRFQVDASKPNGPFVVDLDGDLITVSLPREEWTLVNEMNGRIPDLAHAAIVLPVLMLAISQKGEYSTTRWAGRLHALMDARGINAQNPVAAAQQLLENPVQRGYFGVDRALGEE